PRSNGSEPKPSETTALTAVPSSSTSMSGTAGTRRSVRLSVSVAMIGHRKVVCVGDPVGVPGDPGPPFVRVDVRAGAAGTPVGTEPNEATRVALVHQARTLLHGNFGQLDQRAIARPRVAGQELLGIVGERCPVSLWGTAVQRGECAGSGGGDAPVGDPVGDP